MLVGPAEIDIYILSFLDIKELYRLSSVNKYFYSLFKDENLWRIKLLAYDPNILNFKLTTYKELYLQCYRVFGKDNKNLLRDPDRDDVDKALHYNYLAPLFYLFSINKFIDVETLNMAILTGRDKIVEILLNKKVKLNSDSSIDIPIAAGKGHLNILQLLSARNLFPDELAKWSASNAVMTNKIHILEWLKNKKIFPSRGDANIAAKCGHLEALKWLETIGVLASKYGANCACENNHLEILQWLETIGILPDSVGADNAHHKSHVRILVYLGERNIFPSYRNLM